MQFRFCYFYFQTDLHILTCNMKFPPRQVQNICVSSFSSVIEWLIILQNYCTSEKKLNYKRHVLTKAPCLIQYPVLMGAGALCGRPE